METEPNKTGEGKKRAVSGGFLLDCGYCGLHKASVIAQQSYAA